MNPPQPVSNAPDFFAAAVLESVAESQLVRRFLENAGLEMISSGSDYFAVVTKEGPFKNYAEIFIISREKESIGKQAIDQFIARMHDHYRSAPSARRVGIIIAGHFEMSALQAVSAEIEDGGVVIVLLTVSEISMSVRDSTSEATLRLAIRSAIGLEDVYSRQVPITDPSEFYGRREVMDRLRRLVSSHAPIGLFGMWRIGKTSVLRQMQNKVFWGKKGENAAVAYIDMAIAPSSTEQLLGTMILRFLSDARAKGLINSSSFTIDVNRDYSVSRFKDDLDRLMARIGEDHPHFRMVIVLDDIDSALTTSRSSHITFRRDVAEAIHELVSINVHQWRLTPVFCGKRPEHLFSSRNLDFENYFTDQLNPVFLTPMFSDDCTEMIAGIGSRMNMRWTPEALQLIFHESGGHPLVARFLGSRVWNNRLNQQLDFDVSDVERAVTVYSMSPDNYYARLKQLRFFSELEMKTLHALATGENIPSNYDDDAQQSIESLVHFGLVKKHENTYSIMGNILKRWLSDH